MEQLFIYLMMYLPIVVIIASIPYVTRRTESFGISIPSEAYHDPTIVTMRKKYVGATILLSILLGMVPIFIRSFELALIVIVVGFIVLSFFIYLYFHNQMKQFKKQQNWTLNKKQTIAIDTSFRSQKLTYSNAWFLIGFAFTLLGIWVSIFKYPEMPSQIPLNFDWQGNPTRFGEKSYRTVFMIPMIQLYLLLLFLYLHPIVGKAKQSIDSDSPEESIKRNIIFRRRWSAYILLTGNLLLGFFTLTQLSLIYSFDQALMGGISLTITIVLVIGAIILALTTGQGGSRMKMSGTTDIGRINRDQDEYWKLGIFYMNRKDPSLWVEKRFGIGWTVNLAHPIAWVVLSGIIIIPILISLLSS